MPTTKKVVAALALLVIAALHRNIAIVREQTNLEDTASAAIEAFIPWHNTTGYIGNDAKNVASAQSDPLNKLIHVAIFGLGHRLIRATAAWHLAQRLNLPRFKFQWGSCGNEDSKELNIFPFLFGQDEWDVPLHQANTTNTVSRQGRGRNVIIRNDVYGYLPAQTFQDHRIPLDESIYQGSTSPFHEKLASDTHFYQQLQRRFKFSDLVHQFMEQHRFSDHTVIGIHLRAGNGEGEHFVHAGRHIANETVFVTNLIQLVGRSFLMEKALKKPPLIFLATDTAYLVPTISNLTERFRTSTVVLPQIRVADNQGVTFSALSGAGQKCLLGWQAMMADMILLSQTDILIAARHSSFTQSMPISLIFERTKNHSGPHFCEVSTDATNMACFQDVLAWLYRNQPQKEWRFSLDSVVADSSLPEVHHKALIHLPDKDIPKQYDDVVAFLSSSGGLSGRSPNDDEKALSFSYGNKRFNPKYRNKKPSDSPGWNFTSS